MTTATSNDDHAHPHNITLFRHRKRPAWGCAILLWDRGGKREYQFEDGKRRVFARRFCKLLEPVDRPLHEITPIRRNLLATAGRDVQRVSPSKTNALPLASQIAFFKDNYANGFRDDAWIGAKRGDPKKKQLKRHREPIIERARELLAKGRLDALIDGDRHGEIIDSMIELTRSTDLVSKAQASPLDRVAGNPTASAEMAVALRDLLYGDEEYAIRFERFVAVLRRASNKAASWQLATLFPALVHATEHLFVKPKTTDAQAEWLAPGLVMTNRPTAHTYQRLRGMAMSLGERLGEAGLAPRDLLDLHDFMWETLRPKARALIEEMYRD